MFEFPFKTATHPNEACFNKPAGYLYLIERYKLKALPNRHLSYIGVNETFWYYLQENSISETYPAFYWPGESDLAHLRFALRYDGINLGILARLFEAIPTSELIEHIAEAPEEILRRKIWFLYEFITQKELPLPDLNHPCSEELLLPEDIYYTIPGTLSKRHFIRNNLLGKNGFCPILWKTDKLNEILNLDLTSRCKELVKAYPPELMERALTYLHKKETRSSFEIEHIEPDTSRTGKFLTLLQRASQTDFCNKKLLIEVQNQIVDPRFKDNDYRCEQNYVGQSISHRKEIIHYISPRPEDINNLMDFEGADALDLFAGTGSISFELLSRGCRRVTAVEKNAAHASFIAKVARELKTDALDLVRGDVFRYLKSAPKEGFDIIFADPPYSLPELPEVPTRVLEGGLLRMDGVFIMEHSKANDFSALPYFYQHRAYGSVNFSIFRRT